MVEWNEMEKKKEKKKIYTSIGALCVVRSCMCCDVQSVLP